MNQLKQKLSYNLKTLEKQKAEEKVKCFDNCISEHKIS